MTLLLLLFAVAAASAVAEKARYDHYQVHRVLPTTQQHLEALHTLETFTDLSFWTEIGYVSKPVDIMVPPHKKPIFQDFLKNTGMKSSVQIDNLQELIGAEEERMEESLRATNALEWTDYHPLEDIYAFLDELAANNSNIEVIVGGTTYEKRDIKGIQITNGADLPGVILESGIHAREWIGPAASTWIVNQIVNSPANSVWRKVNYIYFPSVNPDGYVYTHEKDRLWRKTRKPYPGNCIGADPNRNYGYHWNEGGSTNDPCSEIYAGPSAFSEIETKSLSEFLTKVAPKFDSHIAFHSYSQLLMFPWGYTATHTPNHQLWQRIGDAAAAAITAVHGTEFEVGNIYETIYQTSGTSTEWYYGAFNATLAYTFELRDTGKYGFVLPPEQIIPVAEELIEGVRVLIEERLKL